MSAVILRPADEHDAALMSDLIRTAFAQYEGLFDPPSGAHGDTPEKVAGKLAKGGGFVALLNGEAIGCVLYQPENGFLYLGRLAVLPERRKRGAARLLIAAVEEQARTLDLPKVNLAVRAALPQNRIFFESLGYQFVSYGRHEGYSEPTFVTLEKEV